ncbi:F0F1 ATP synthase subunit B [Mycolicibacterium stellerae]|uniref:F0F1 ATP synthase subunit B n=1 Tax=Mycolicibacterium stellerae TaxID=2358193 RepID=UPI000F0B21AF|nr:F0F1 ATP synthase subunit B [Mycolicibacterium stellerae]
MGDVNVRILAAEEGGQSNFLIPNGTFFFVLLIFLIVLGVIAKWVVPPISKVLREREAMVQKTNEDNRHAAQLRAAADADYLKVMGTARREATNVREQARADGRKIVDEAKARANAEVSSVLQQATEELTEQSRAVTADLQTSVEALASQLASRVLGVEVTSRTVPAATGQGR